MERAREPSIALGKAIQLINILRDAAPDAALGRVYLPQDMLASEKASNEDTGLGIVRGVLQSGAEGYGLDQFLAEGSRSWKVVAARCGTSARPDHCGAVSRVLGQIARNGMRQPQCEGRLGED